MKTVMPVSRLLPALLLLAVGCQQAAPAPTAEPSAAPATAEITETDAPAIDTPAADTPEPTVDAIADDTAHWVAERIGPPYASVLDVAIDPLQPDNFYAAGVSYVFKSIDRGASWDKVPLTDAEAVNSLLIRPGSPPTIYAVTGIWDRYYDSSRHLYTSTDSGGSWDLSENGLILPNTNGRLQAAITGLAIDPAQPSTLYLISSYEGVYKSTDSGRDWLRISDSKSQFTNLVVDPNTPSTLYAGTMDEGLLKSTDSGQTWLPTWLPATMIDALAMAPGTPSLLVAGLGDDGVATSKDGGRKWAQHRLGGYVNALAIDPSQPSTFYAAASSKGLLRSTDSGATWSVINTGLTDIYSLTAAPSTPDVYAIVFDKDGGAIYHIHPAQ